MSLIARLMDKSNRQLISKVIPKKEKHFEDAKENNRALYENGAYTNGIQDL